MGEVWALSDITGRNLESWYLLWGADPQCSDPGWSLWDNLWTLSLVCIGAHLARGHGLTVLFKKTEITGYPFWGRFSSAPLWAREGTSSVLTLCLVCLWSTGWVLGGTSWLAYAVAPATVLCEVRSVKSVKSYLTENGSVPFSWSVISYCTVGFLYLGRFVSCSSCSTRADTPWQPDTSFLLWRLTVVYWGKKSKALFGEDS